MTTDRPAWAVEAERRMNNGVNAKVAAADTARRTKRMSSPTARTLALLRKHGHEIGIVERWIPQARKRIDLFGCIDLVAIVGGRIVGIQATSGGSGGNVAARIAKAKAEPRLIEWLGTGARFWVIGWAKQGAQGKRKVWKYRVEELTYSGGEWHQSTGFHFQDAGQVVC